MVIRSYPDVKKFYMRSTDDGFKTGKTGPLKCRKGFTARARLKTPVKDKSTWRYEYVYLIDAKVPVGECRGKIESVYNKEDPDTWAYGVWPGTYQNSYSFNLKTTSIEKYASLPQSEPVIIKYDKEKREVRFTSAHFNLFQTDLPEEVDFCLAVTIGGYGFEIEIELLSLE